MRTANCLAENETSGPVRRMLCEPLHVETAEPEDPGRQ
jgi:hypothetical protein